VHRKAPEDTSELQHQLHSLGLSLAESAEAEAALRMRCREVEQQVEIKGNNTSIIQEQYAALKQMYHDLKKNFHLIMGSLEHAPSGFDREE